MLKRLSFSWYLVYQFSSTVMNTEVKTIRSIREQSVEEGTYAWETAVTEGWKNLLCEEFHHGPHQNGDNQIQVYEKGGAYGRT